MTLTAGGITRAASASARMNANCPELKDSKASAQTASASTAIGSNAGGGVVSRTVDVAVSAKELGGDVSTSKAELLVLALALVEWMRPFADVGEDVVKAELLGLVEWEKPVDGIAGLLDSIVEDVIVGRGVLELVKGGLDVDGEWLVVKVVESTCMVLEFDVVLHVGHDSEKVFIVFEVFQNSTSPTMLPCQLSPVPPIRSNTSENGSRNKCTGIKKRMLTYDNARAPRSRSSANLCFVDATPGAVWKGCSARVGSEQAPIDHDGNSGRIDLNSKDNLMHAVVLRQSRVRQGNQYLQYAVACQEQKRRVDDADKRAIVLPADLEQASLRAWHGSVDPNDCI